MSTLTALVNGICSPFTAVWAWLAPPNPYMAGWQPMHEAPRDGRSVLLLTRDHGQVEAWFCPGEWQAQNEYGDREYQGALWVCGDDAWVIDVEERSTFAVDNGHDYYYDGAALFWRELHPVPVLADRAPVSEPQASAPPMAVAWATPAT